MKRNSIWLLGVALALWTTATLRTAARAAEGDQKIRVACVGDSITAGGYPKLLGAELGPKYEVRNFGVSGTTLLKAGDNPYWKTKQFTQVGEFEPNIIVIMLGTNDTKPQNWKHKEHFADDLRAMVEHYAGLKSKPRVYVCRPVPVHKTNYGINELVMTEGVIPAIDAVVKEMHLPLIDLHLALKDSAKDFPDGVHPNAAGQEKMAKAIAAELTKEPK